MSMADFRAFSQFAHARDGSWTRAGCMIASMLECLHAVAPNKYVLTGDEFELLVQQQKRAGLYSETSGETLSAVVHQLVELGVQGYGVYPYAEPFPTDWKRILTVQQNNAPTLVQVANGAAFGYSPNLQYHAIACGRAYGAMPKFGFGDPANPVCQGGELVDYTIEELSNARVCGLIVFPYCPAPRPSPHLDEEAAANKIAELYSLFKSAGLLP